MKLFESLFNPDPKQTHEQEQKIIAEIHKDFDTAQDRLLDQANKILSELKVDPQAELEDKARRLKNIGFINTPTAKKAEQVIEKRKEVESQIVKTREEAELIKYYKRIYPFQKFLTEQELDRICNKYGLIYAPVNAFIQEVPDKNLKDIENAKALSNEDRPPTAYKVKVTEFWESVPQEIKELLKDEVIYDDDLYIDKPSENGLSRTIKKLGYKGNYTGYIYRTATIKKINRSGLFICAPQSHFDLKDLSKESKLGFFKVETREIKDPIVFRYCKGGIQVLSKWGLEASDPALLNEIDN